MNESATPKVLYFVFPIDTNNFIIYSNKDYMLRREGLKGLREFQACTLSTPIGPYLAKHTSLFMTITEC